MGKLRILHALNQFFGGIGGEDQAGMAPRLEPGPRGPGNLLSSLDPDIEVVATLVFGDDYAAEHPERALEEMLALVERAAEPPGPPQLLLAGPAFNAGRYGMTCGALCRAAQERGLPAVTGMFGENPGAEMFGRDVVIVEASRDVMGMRQALERMLLVGRKLVDGEPIDPTEDGTLPQGRRQNAWRERTGAQRAVALLLDKLRGADFETEYAMPVFDRVPPAQPLADIAHARIALVTSGGIVPLGNPDRIEAASASRFGEYSLEGIEALSAKTHETAHGGYDPTHANADPNRVLPVDVLRELEQEGHIGRLHDRYYATVGNGTSVDRARQFGEQIAARLVSDGVQAVILTST
jgi:glycine reductase